LYEYLVSFWEASMLARGSGIGYTGPWWAPLTISVWWRGRSLRVCLNVILLFTILSVTAWNFNAKF